MVCVCVWCLCVCVWGGGILLVVGGGWGLWGGRVGGKEENVDLVTVSIMIINNS